MPDVVVDACCLINLRAARDILCLPPSATSARTRQDETASTSEPSEQVHRLNLTLHVPEIVVRESLYLMQPDDNDEDRLVKKPIDLTPCFNSGLLDKCDVQSPDEADLFVRLATRLDDGEAVCLALAITRRWILATDDRRARRLAGQLGVEVISTPELVKRWAEDSLATDEAIVSVLQNIQIYARFVPRAGSPGYEWWTRQFDV